MHGTREELEAQAASATGEHDLYCLRHVGAVFGLAPDPASGSRNERGVFIEELRIKRGRMTAIIGDSGSGKTTLLHLLAGFTPVTPRRLQPDSVFTLHLPGDDTPWNDPRTVDLINEQLGRNHRSRLGFVFQFSHLLRHATAAANLALPRAIHGLEIDKAQLEAAFSSLGLGPVDKLDSRARLMSGGEAQRAALARALIHGPALVLADEPTGSLDPMRGKAIMAHLRAWQREDLSRSVVWVTHNLEDVSETADDVIVLKDGALSDALGPGKSWPQPNPCDPKLLLEWMSDGAARALDGNFHVAFPPASGRRRPKRGSWLQRLATQPLLAKLAGAELISGDSVDKPEEGAAVNRLLSYRTGWPRLREWLIAPWQALQGFAKWGTLSAFVLSLAVFFAVSHAREVFGKVFDAMQKDPWVAHVLAKQDFKDHRINEQNLKFYRQAFGRCLEERKAGSCLPPSIETPEDYQQAFMAAGERRMFGRWIESQNVSVALPTQAGGRPACPPVLGTPVNLLAMDLDEPVFGRVAPGERLSGDRAPIYATGDSPPDDWMVITRELLYRLHRGDKRAPAPGHLCLKLFDGWRLTPVINTIEAAPPDDIYAINTIVSSRYYKARFFSSGDVTPNTNVEEDRDKELDSYHKIAIYFDPREIEAIKHWARATHHTLTEDAFSRVERLLGMSGKASTMIDGFYLAMLFFVAIFILVSYWNYVLENEKFLCVLRANGAGFGFVAGLIIYQVLSLCVLAGLLLTGVTLVLDRLWWPGVKALYNLPDSTPGLMNSLPNALVMFTALGLFVSCLIAVLWISRNRYVGYRLKTLG